MAAPDVPQGLLKLDVSATDSAGMPVTGLTQQDFTLLDNNQPRQILSFHASDKSDPPTQVILFIDVLFANALTTEIENGAAAFLRQNGGHLTHPISVYRFSAEGLGRVGTPSMDGNALAAEVEKGHQDIIQSALYANSPFRGAPAMDPAFTHPTVRALVAIAKIGAEERQKPGRKLLLWVGPGYGIGTGAALSEDIHPTAKSRREKLGETDWYYTLMRDARITLDVFSVGPHDPAGPTPGGPLGISVDAPAPLLEYTDFLTALAAAKPASSMLLYKKVLAIQSGGKVFEPSSGMVDQMESSVRNADTFYTVSIDPPKTNQPADYHTLTVETAKPQLLARTQSGYFDQPYYTDQTDAATTPITVQQLGQLLRDPHSRRDTAIAEELSNLRLTERLDSPRLAALTASLSGEKSRQQLTILADASAFLDPSASEIPTDDAPDDEAQQQMISRALEAVSTTIPKLPNVFAARSTIRYQENAQYDPAAYTVVTQTLHKADTSNVMVDYRSGAEVVEAGSTTSRKPKPGEPSLAVYGTFGPLLTSAVDILSRPGQMTWKRWGQGPTGRSAVFSYSLPASSLSWGTTGCCLPDGQGTDSFPHPSKYRGEIEIDPATGALLRIEIRAEPRSNTSILRADVVIEYGPVDIAGKTYVCPLRSVALTRERSIITATLAKESSGMLANDSGESFRTSGPYATMLNDITFSNYHVFRAQSRILTSFSTVP
jgi:VWFA-related protein